MTLKRLRDTTTKQIVWIIGPSGKPCQAWINKEGTMVYVYDGSKRFGASVDDLPDGYVYGSQRKQINPEDTVGFYDTNKPTELFDWDAGDKARYYFKDWDGTILQQGTVDEGETPEYTGATPTREATAQYTYTFTGRAPAVGPITKKTEYVAQYSSVVNEYTINFLDYDESVISTATLAYGATPTVPEDPTRDGYRFTGWSPEVATVTGDQDYTAQYVAVRDIAISPKEDDTGTVDIESIAVDEGTTISANDNVLTIGTTDITATAAEGYQFTGWEVEESGDPLPETVTGDLGIVAVFTEVL